MTFSTNIGSLDSLNPSARFGLSSNLDQIRPIVDLDNPDRAAIELRDQCVALAGLSSNVVTRTSSTLSKRIDGGRPGRGSSTNPSSRFATNRPRHFDTVFADTPTSVATCAFVAPCSAHANTIRERNAND